MTARWFARFDRDGVAFDCTTCPDAAADWQRQGWHVDSLPRVALPATFRWIASYGLRMASVAVVLLLGFLSGTTWGYFASWATLALWLLALGGGYLLWVCADLAEPWTYPEPEFSVED